MIRLPRTLFVLPLVLMVAAGCSTPTTPNSGTEKSEQNQGSKVVTSEPTKNPTTIHQTKEADKAKKMEKEVDLIFSDDNLMEQYKEIHTISYENKNDLPMLALKEWKKGPKNKKLIGMLPADVNIQSVKRDGNDAVVSFSSNVKKANLGSTGEAMLLEQIATILHQLGYKDTKFVIDGKQVESILGHVDTTTPVQPLDLAQVKEMN